MTIYRSHVEDCPFRKLGKSYTACSCPIKVSSKDLGIRNLGTSDWTEAMKKLSDEQTIGAISPKDFKRGRLDQAVKVFLDQKAKSGLSENTMANYRCVMGRLKAFAGVGKQLDTFTIDTIERYQDHRGLNKSSWMNELAILRNFFSFCQRRGWCKSNPAKLYEAPRGIRRSRQVDPYTDDELVAMVDACGRLPYPYDRRRGLAAILLLIHFGLRICDIAGLRRSSIDGGRIELRARKNDKQIRLPVPGNLQAALDNVPNHSNTYYFWRGRSKRQLERLLGKVFKEAGVEGATPHRFRHTLATKMLSRGATMDDVADVLGDSPDTIRKHYAKWTPEREERLGRFLS